VSAAGNGHARHRFLDSSPSPGARHKFRSPIFRADSRREDRLPPDAGLSLPAPLTLGANQFAFLVTVEVCFLCGFLIQIIVPRETDRTKEGRQAPRRDQRPNIQCAKLSIWTVGRPVVTANSHGGRDIGEMKDSGLMANSGA
jgi:hypothetical protein